MMNALQRIRLLTPAEHDDDTHDAQQRGDATLAIANDDELEPHGAQIAAATCIVLQFPTFTDGRAYSQAYLLRKRFGYAGDLRATGDVMVDQLLLMERTGFSSAVLREDADMADAQHQLERFPGFYQRDARSESETPPQDAAAQMEG
ncbi:DUF934 domain-containing protein [Burkholderia sp. PU8-34]